jgi:hypothetical protein
MSRSKRLSGRILATVNMRWPSSLATLCALFIVGNPKALDELFVDGVGNGRAQIGKHKLV